MTSAVFLGIDIGTSGIRASCINVEKQELISHHIAFKSQLPVHGKNEQNPDDWLLQLDKLLIETSRQLKKLDSHYCINAISIDGTSGTLIDAYGVIDVGTNNILLLIASVIDCINVIERDSRISALGL